MAARLGLVGAGRWGQVFIQTLSTNFGGSLVALASTNPEADKFVSTDCRVEREWRKLTSAPDIDGVIIATPPATHAAIAEQAMRSGKAVLVEKALTLSSEEAEALCRVGDETDSLCMVDHTHLYQSAFQELALRVKGAASNKCLIRSAAGNHGPFRPDTSVLWDWGPHDIAMCLAITASLPNKVRAERTTGESADGELGEQWKIELEFSDSCEAQIEFSNLRDEKCRQFEISLDDEAYLYDDLAKVKLQRRLRDGNEISIETDPTPPVTRLIQDFIAAIESNSKDRAGLRLGADVVNVLAQCEAAAHKC